MDATPTFNLGALTTSSYQLAPTTKESSSVQRSVTHAKITDQTWVRGSVALAALCADCIRLQDVLVSSDDFSGDIL
jgi:hypothetical protein